MTETQKPKKKPVISITVPPDVMERVPLLYRQIYKKAMSGNSKAAGIKAHCLECIGYQRKLVTNCTSKYCPLYPYRPYQED